MTKEDKQILLKDLCGRLPYNVLVHIYDIDVCDYDNFLCEDYLAKFRVNSIILKPYLRPLSSMTEKERKEIGILIREKRPNPYGIINNNGVDNLLFSVSVTSRLLIDWLNAHHFDYRGLIENDLAIEITEENNPYKSYGY